MRRLWRAAFVTLFGALLLVGTMFALLLSTQPAFEAGSPSPRDSLNRTRSILRSGVPGQAQGTVVKVLTLTTQDLETVANFAIARKQLEGYAEATIEGQRLKLQTAIKLPWRWADLFLNIRVIADDATPQAVIKQVKIGRIAIPKPLVQWLLEAVLFSTPLARYTHVAEEVVRNVRIVDDRLRVELNWNRDALHRAHALVTDFSSRERMQVYYHALAETLRRSDLKFYVRLGTLMQPLFAVARERSAQGREPEEENRALILVLNAYVNGQDLGKIVDQDSATAPLPERVPLLNRRVDTAQHFIGSAAMAISGHRALADMIAFAKEINDTHTWSGFSFTDVAADRAGASFGKFAVKSSEQARATQELLSQSQDEALFMPNIKDLPEHLNREAFAARFKNFESSEFGEMKRRIEERIAACPLYQTPLQSER